MEIGEPDTEGNAANTTRVGNLLEITRLTGSTLVSE
jgi:hypothetical protein